jgi:peptidylprolyl isomerase
MAQAKDGDRVAVHYEGKLEDGTVFDRSDPSEPLEFTIGECEVIPGLERAVLGMNTGETKTVVIDAEEAYGTYDQDLVMKFDLSIVPPDMLVEPGQILRLRKEDGEEIPVSVIAITDESVTLDGNHPLAGQDLTFDIELIEVG